MKMGSKNGKIAKKDKRKRKLIFLEIFKASSLNFSSFHGILAKSLKNKPLSSKKKKTKKTEPEVVFKLADRMRSM